MPDIKVIKIDALPSMTMAVSPDLYELLRNNSSAKGVLDMTRQMLEEIKENGNAQTPNQGYPVYPPGHLEPESNEEGVGKDGGLYGLRSGPLVPPGK